MSEVNEPDSDSGEVIPFSGRDAPADARWDVDESEDFPVFQYVLLTYFPRNLPNGRQTADRQAEFLDRYASYGEDAAEFAGLVDELRQGIKHPRTVSPIVNEALGISLDPMETRTELASLLDQITQQGEYSEEEDALTKAKKSGERPSAEALLDHWLYRRISVPFGPLEGKSAPLWLIWATGFGVALVGLLIMNYLEPSGWVAWFPRALIASGILVLALSSVAMAGLRNEMLSPEREKKREEAKAKAKEKREDRKESRRKWRNLIQP